MNGPAGSAAVAARRLGVLLLGALAAAGCVSPPPAPAPRPTIFGAHAACACDHRNPESLSARNCSLCRVAEKRSERVFLLADIDPKKPNRWLVLPKEHAGTGVQGLSDLRVELRHEMALFAVAEGDRLYPGGWGLAVNPLQERTQCHLHVHLGPLRKGIPCSNEGTTTADPAAIFDFPGAEGDVWIHREGKVFHIHTAMPMEIVLDP